MKKSSSLILLAALLETACGSPFVRRLMVEIPRPSAIRIESYKELRIADFLTKDNASGLDLNREITQYFKTEWEKKFKGEIRLTGAVPVKAEELKDAAAWKQAAADGDNAIIMAGQASFIRESRKSLQEKKAGWNDGFFATRNTLAEKLAFTLNLSVVFIRGGTGEVLFQNDYKETRTYTNIKQTNDFAFFELLQSAKQKMFRALLGEERVQERYLISK